MESVRVISLTCTCKTSACTSVQAECANVIFRSDSSCDDGLQVSRKQAVGGSQIAGPADLEGLEVR